MHRGQTEKKLKMQRVNVLMVVYSAKRDKIWFKHSFIIKVLKKTFAVGSKASLATSNHPVELVQALRNGVHVAV